MKGKLKATFRAEGPDGKEQGYAVRRPDQKALERGQRVWNRAFREAMDGQAIIRPQVRDYLLKRGMWDDEKQGEFDRLNAKITNLEKVLGRGYKEGPNKERLPVRLSEARDVAIQLLKLRGESAAMQSARSYLDQQTAEAQADNARFNYYVASGLVYNEGEREGQPVFRDLDDYLEHAGEPHAVAAATELMKLLMGDDWRRKLPEYAFLLKYGFVDEQLRLIDPRSKKLIDTEGRPINEKGFLLNEAGEPVNEQGDRIDEEGNLLFEGEPEFTDDDGDAEAASKSEGEKAPSPLQAV